MRKGLISRTAQQKKAIAIEYEDENYTYISSKYPYKVLKKDIEEIKVPIKIAWN